MRQLNEIHRLARVICNATNPNTCIGEPLGARDDMQAGGTCLRQLFLSAGQACKSVDATHETQLAVSAMWFQKHVED